MIMLLAARQWVIDHQCGRVNHVVLSFVQPITVHCVDGTRIADSIRTTETLTGRLCLSRCLTAVSEAARENRRIVGLDVCTTTGDWWSCYQGEDAWASTDEIVLAPGDT